MTATTTRRRTPADQPRRLTITGATYDRVVPTLADFPAPVEKKARGYGRQVVFELDRADMVRLADAIAEHDCDAADEGAPMSLRDALARDAGRCLDLLDG